MFKMLKAHFLRSKKLPLIGIDITPSAVKLLEVHPKGQQLQVASYGIASLENGVINRQNIKDAKSVALSIKRVVERIQPATLRSAVAVPASAVLSRTLSLPRALNDDEMEIQVLVEAERHLPYPLNKAAIDFQRQPPLNPNDDTQPVLLIACRRETTDQLDRIIKEAGLQPLAIDIESFAMERALHTTIKKLPQQQKSQLIAVADMGAYITKLSILSSGHVIYNAEPIFGGQQFAAVISQIKQQLQLFFSASTFDKIDYLILAGDLVLADKLSTSESLVQKAQEYFGIKTILANPFSDMLISKKINSLTLALDAPSMIIACGLAVKIAN